MKIGDCLVINEICETPTMIGGVVSALIRSFQFGVENANRTDVERKEGFLPPLPIFPQSRMQEEQPR